ncbi:MAG: hypothetical protein M0Q95_04255 [Porticoccaceae bacterium]|nr:hypothetical protein [Porticoccaceae bacterium]
MISIHHRRQLAILLVSALVIGLLLGFAFGGRIFSDAMLDYRRMEKQLADTETLLNQRDQELANLTIADKVNQLTQEKLREKVTELRTELVSLEGELYLYKNLVEDDEGQLGLSLENITLRKTGDDNSFLYQIVVRRKEVLSQTIDATLALSIEGSLLKIPDTIAFSEADPAMDEDNISFRFKYFKVIQGTFVLPEHFVPEKLVVSLYETGRPNSLVIKEYPWRVSEF